MIDKVQNKEGVWFKVKWTGWGEEYNQWLPVEELAGASELTQAYEAKSGSKRKSSAGADDVPPHDPSRSKRRRRKG